MGRDTPAGIAADWDARLTGTTHGEDAQEIATLANEAAPAGRERTCAPLVRNWSICSANAHPSCPSAISSTAITTVNSVLGTAHVSPPHAPHRL
jgi:hypothetical protein